MSRPVQVQIIASPVACATGVRDSWREAATWVANQLAAHFGDAVSFQYFDLFDADCPAIPDGARLPLVLVNGQIVSSGEKLSAPAIRRWIESMNRENESGS